jgi:HK97 family phage prohead protease
LVGYASVFDAASEDLGGFREYVRKGAFTRTLREGADVLALVHHRPELVLGRRSAGTLRLSEDDRGLAFDLTLPDTTAARDLAVSVDRGDIKGASFSFTVPARGDRWSKAEGRTIRELLDVNLHDITVTATPAYPDTEVARRALLALRTRPRLAVRARFLETC